MISPAYFSHIQTKVVYLKVPQIKGTLNSSHYLTAFIIICHVPLCHCPEIKDYHFNL